MGKNDTWMANISRQELDLDKLIQHKKDRIAKDTKFLTCILQKERLKKDIRKVESMISITLATGLKHDIKQMEQELRRLLKQKEKDERRKSNLQRRRD